VPMRVFSSSLLFAYESDARAFAEKEAAAAARDTAAPPPLSASSSSAAAAAAAATGRCGGRGGEEREGEGVDEGEVGYDEEGDEEDDEGDEEEEEEALTLATVKLIDFAHARLAPGEGPDENVLRGVRALVGALERLHAGLEREAALALAPSPPAA
jgi:Inositol polyphosphate kinase